MLLFVLDECGRGVVMCKAVKHMSESSGGGACLGSMVHERCQQRVNPNPNF